MAYLPEALAEFDADLTQILMANVPSDRKLLATYFAKHYTDKALVRELVNSVTRDDSFLMPCAENSAQHPLGFDKYVLHATELYQLRLHVWWPNQVHGIEHVHNHRFSFVSGVIVGDVRLASYSSAQEELEFTHFKEIKQASGAYEYQALGRLSLKLMNLQSLAPGSAYYLDSRELHRVTVADKGLSATLFVRLANDHDYTDVLVRPGTRPPATGIRDSMPPDDVKERLQSFADALS